MQCRRRAFRKEPISASSSDLINGMAHNSDARQPPVENVERCHRLLA
jgi:hypothetical protein